MKQGLLLFAHGARDPNWARPFETVRHTIQQQRPDLPVELAFLEFMEPALSVAAQRLAEQGCTQVAVVPLFLGAGGHVRKDLPTLLADLARAHGDIAWELKAAIGEIDSVIASMATAALAMTGDPAPSDSK